MNYDGAIFQEQGRVSIGVVVHNSKGVMLASLSQQVPLPTIVAQVEALVVRRAIKLTLEIGITQATIKGDFETIYKDLTNPGASLALHGRLIHDIKRLLNAFTNINFTHVHRPGNIVAPSLARRAIMTPNLNI